MEVVVEAFEEVDVWGSNGLATVSGTRGKELAVERFDQVLIVVRG